MEIGHPIVRIRRDMGREFDNVDVNLFFKSKGIKHEYLAPRTSQQNGIVETKNRVLQEMARVMTRIIPLCNFGQKLLIQRATLLIGFFSGLAQRRHLMNYGL